MSDNIWTIMNLIFGYPHMNYHIWTIKCGPPYMNNHIWSTIYDNAYLSYVNTHIWSSHIWLLKIVKIYDHMIKNDKPYMIQKMIIYERQKMIICGMFTYEHIKWSYMVHEKWSYMTPVKITIYDH